MKKQPMYILVVVTLVFAAFTLGLLLGRSGQHGGVTLSVPAPMLTEPVPTETVSSPAPTEIQFPIDLNTAGLEELTALPGIGEVLARRILHYREEHGAFQAVEELLNIEDIGEKRLEAMIELVRIGG